MFQSHIERFSPCRGGPQVCCARPDRERQRPGLRLTPDRWNPDLSMRRRFKRMMGRARGRRTGVRPRMKWTTTTTTRAGCLLHHLSRHKQLCTSRFYCDFPIWQNARICMDINCRRVRELHDLNGRRMCDSQVPVTRDSQVPVTRCTIAQ